MYSYFADFYDSLTANVEYEKRADYILEVLKRHNKSSGLILDMCCGTGSLTIALKKRGADIFGSDASREMLTIAQQKAFENEENILFINQKMQELSLPYKIDVCICTLDSVNHITSKQELIKGFSKINSFLDDDGIFIFDANTVYKHKNILGDNCYIYDTKDVFCAWQNNYNPKNNRVIITLDFFIPNRKGYDRYSEQFSERAYTRDEMSEMLNKAGMIIEAVYDDLSFVEPRSDSQREIYIVRKRINE